MRKKRGDCILGPLWIDYDFDQNDQLARKYLKYQGKYYDVGTIVKIKGDMKKEALAEFKGWYYNNHGNFKSLDGGAFDIWDNYNFSAANKYIIEIVTPVYPQLETKIVAKGDDREKTPSWTVEVAWIWYIVIMIALAFFKARWLGWIAATVIFFGWKSGFFSNKKK